jgi:hypothetical protein
MFMVFPRIGHYSVWHERSWVPEEMGLIKIYGSAAIADLIRH